LRVHVLAIFPPEIGSGIDRIFPKGFPDESRRDKDADAEFDSFDDIIKKITDGVPQLDFEPLYQ